MYGLGDQLPGGDPNAGQPIPIATPALLGPAPLNCKMWQREECDYSSDAPTCACKTTPLSILAFPARAIASIVPDRWRQEADTIGMIGAAALYLGLIVFGATRVFKGR